MTQAIAWLGILTAWVSLLWLGAVVMEWLIPMLRRNTDTSGRKNNHT